MRWQFQLEQDVERDEHAYYNGPPGHANNF